MIRELVQRSLLFPKKRFTWNCWGIQFNFSWPRLNGEIHPPENTRRQAGEESLLFYDSAVHYEGGKLHNIYVDHVGEKATSEEKLLQLNGENQALLFSRRRAINCWRVKIGRSTESFWADFWIYRNYQNGDLRLAEKLQSAHLQWLSLTNPVHKTPDILADNCQHEEDLGLNLDEDFVDSDFFDVPGFCRDDFIHTGLHWREEVHNRLKWQVFDEYNQKFKHGQTAIIALGESHYFAIRMYRLQTGDTRKFADAFDLFCRSILGGTEIHGGFEQSLGSIKAFNDEQVNEITSSPIEWRQFNNNPPVRYLAQSEDANKHDWLLIVYSLSIIVGVLLLGIFLLGAFNVGEWLRANEVPYSSWINSGIFLVLLIHYLLPSEKPSELEE